jgi:hypothetical protein
MGEAKRRTSRRERFLQEHPRCAYCAQVATTTDHCPPRSFFFRRSWPETYEFPACQACNAEARLDEQLLALLVRIGLKDHSGPRYDELVKLAAEVRNNQPEVMAEWRIVRSGNERRRMMRERFGATGEALRQEGFAAAEMGTLTQDALRRFGVKLAKALHYRHNRSPFEGVIYLSHLNGLMESHAPLLDTALGISPLIAEIQRSGKDLSDQFAYRFNYSPEAGVIHAVARFSEQILLQIIAVGWEMEARLSEWLTETGKAAPFQHRMECCLPSA